MQIKGPDRKLEAFKIFPYVAWLLIIIFALFVYKITIELKSTASELERNTGALEQSVNAKGKAIQQDFEK